MNELRECRECKAMRPIGDFYLMDGYRVRRCKPCYRALTKRWKDLHKTPEREAKWVADRKVQRARIKDAVFAAYGGYVCACCGETERLFLTLDHIDNDGAKWRIEKFGARNYSGYRTYALLLREKFPSGFQVLCMNCNFGKRMNAGVCPHSVRCNDHPLVGVGPSGPKRIAPILRLVGDEMVSPALKNAAV